MVLIVETQLEVQALKGIELEQPFSLGDEAELTCVVEIRKECQLRREVLSFGDVPGQIGADDPFGLEAVVKRAKLLSAAETQTTRERENMEGLPCIIETGDVDQAIADAAAPGDPVLPGLELVEVVPALGKVAPP